MEGWGLEFFGCGIIASMLSMQLYLTLMIVSVA